MRRFYQVIPHRAANPRESIIKTGQPAVVLGQESVEERPALVGRSSHQVGPGARRPLAARHHGLASPHFEHPSEKVQDVRIRTQTRERPGLAQAVGGFPVELGKTKVQPAGGRIGNQRFHKTRDV